LSSKIVACDFVEHNEAGAGVAVGVPHLYRSEGLEAEGQHDLDEL
jgi:hypothetical protein